jgi:hypothetical protein
VQSKRREFSEEAKRRPAVAHAGLGAPELAESSMPWRTTEMEVYSTLRLRSNVMPSHLQTAGEGGQGIAR